MSALAALTALEDLSLARNRLGGACTFGIPGAAAAAAALAGERAPAAGGAPAAMLLALTRLCLADNCLASLPALQLHSMTGALPLWAALSGC